MPSTSSMTDDSQLRIWYERLLSAKVYAIAVKGIQLSVGYEQFLSEEFRYPVKYFWFIEGGFYDVLLFCVISTIKM